MKRWLLACLVFYGCGDNIHPEAPGLARIDTAISPNPVVAGDPATVTCTVYDTAGNVVDDQSPTLVISPNDAGTTVDELSVVLDHAGHYSAECMLDGAAGTAVPFDVVHALPATLVIAKTPDLPVYAIDAAITITHAVTDRFGNPIDDAMVTTSSTPVTGLGPTSILSLDSFSYGGEGMYRVDAVVMPPTDGGVAVTASLNVIVNQNGPTIACGTPGDGTMLNTPVGSTIAFTGTANDINGTMDVTVDGTSVPLASDGTFSVQITTQFGINFVEVVATDTYGVARTKVCTFLAASQWASPGTIYNDTVALDLTQNAIDDGARTGAIGSLGDILYAVANSQGIRTTLDSALTAANPLKADSCDSQTCVPIVGCICWYSSAIEYESSSIDGPNTDSLTLVSGGIGATARVNGIHMNLGVSGTVAGIGFSTSGDVDISFISVALTLDTSLVNNKPHVSVHPSSASSSVGSITTSFAGVDGWIINNIVVPLAQGSLRNAVSSQITSFISTNFNNVLDGVVGGLDISSLGTSFNVPRLDGTGSVPLSFSISPTSLSTTAARMLFGIGSRFSATTANAYPTLGVAVPAGTVLADPVATGPDTTVAAHVALFNQALHALWKANFFSATIDGSTLNNPNAPPGLALTVQARLPPVASFDGANHVNLALGDVDVALSAPSLPPNLSVTLGARAHTAVTLVGNDLQFSGIVIDELHLTSDLVDWDQMDQQMLEGVLESAAQQLVDQSLNSALPALPIPSFPIPASLATYGVPPGNLGIGSPSLSITPPHFVLRGDFGIH